MKFLLILLSFTFYFQKQSHATVSGAVFADESFLTLSGLSLVVSLVSLASNNRKVALISGIVFVLGEESVERPIYGFLEEQFPFIQDVAIIQELTDQVLREIESTEFLDNTESAKPVKLALDPIEVTNALEATTLSRDQKEFVLRALTK
jgi:hypothetical protein